MRYHSSRDQRTYPTECAYREADIVGAISTEPSRCVIKAATVVVNHSSTDLSRGIPCLVVQLKCGSSSSYDNENKLIDNMYTLWEHLEQSGVRRTARTVYGMLVVWKQFTIYVMDGDRKPSFRPVYRDLDVDNEKNQAILLRLLVRVASNANAWTPG